MAPGLHGAPFVVSLLEHGHMAPGLHGARASFVVPFKKKSKMAFKCFKKIETKILDLDNVQIYKPAKSQFKIWCILGYRKKTILIKFQILRIYILFITHADLQICLFC
jgi:hypothetical protein